VEKEGQVQPSEKIRALVYNITWSVWFTCLCSNPHGNL